MKQHPTQQDCYFASQRLAVGAEDLLGRSPPIGCLDRPNQDIENFLSLESPEPLSRSEIVAQSFCPDHSTKLEKDDDLLGSQIGLLSPASNLCSVTVSSTYSGIKEQLRPPFLQLSLGPSGSRVKEMIQFLVDKSQLKKQILDAQGELFCQNDEKLFEVFQILATKFKGLKKTKEEMTKYCMRKAFKFVSQLNRREKLSALSLEEYMKQYCAQREGPNTISAPFKKHSADKTINTSFISKVFSSQKFSAEYRLFLDQFDVLAWEDNQRKISYLTSQVEHALTSGQISHVHKIKRLPWTKEILRKARNLAASLAEENETNRS